MNNVVIKMDGNNTVSSECWMGEDKKECPEYQAVERSYFPFFLFYGLVSAMSFVSSLSSPNRQADPNQCS